MKKLGCLGIILIAVIALVLWGLGKYNSLVSQDENVNKAWAQVENQYQRRADLIPNLVETVKGYAEHESETLQNVIEARAKATSITVDPNNLTEEALKQYQQAQGELSNALGRLMVTIERYPDLKANQNFLELQSQLEGTENRVNNARDAFNEAAQTYNTMVRKFPANIVASIFGFKNKAYFAAAEGASEAPKVQF
ncbi:MAG: LemA family protein [Bacteroidales bacterium]|nr:LemA family protein [Bacteroidales bacterium]MBP5518878.1 LemA family protein [Bacteroidales bacterium]